MIIKNNFNNKSVNPLSDYKSISKTRDNNIENVDIESDVDKDIINDILEKDNEFDEENNDNNNDNWDFFR